MFADYFREVSKLALTKAGYSVGDTIFWYGSVLKIQQIDDEIHYDNFGQPHIVVLANNGKTYWLRAD